MASNISLFSNITFPLFFSCDWVLLFAGLGLLYVKWRLPTAGWCHGASFRPEVLTIPGPANISRSFSVCVLLSEEIGSLGLGGLLLILWWYQGFTGTLVISQRGNGKTGQLLPAVSHQRNMDNHTRMSVCFHAHKHAIMHILTMMQNMFLPLLMRNSKGNIKCCSATLVLWTQHMNMHPLLTLEISISPQIIPPWYWLAVGVP